jgi:hypothetical protein
MMNNQAENITPWQQLAAEGMTSEQIKQKLGVEPVLRLNPQTRPISVEQGYDITQAEVFPTSIREIEDQIDEQLL